MVRRWSRLNNFNFFHNSNFFFAQRFTSLKLLKAVNYKKFTYGLTKFNRHKLAKWKRHSVWLPYVNVFKFWIRDYNFFKKLIKSQFVDASFTSSCLIYNFNYIKKKNILREINTPAHFIQSLSRTLIYYFNKKFPQKNSLFFLLSLPNTNSVFANFIKKQNLMPDSQLCPLLWKAENQFYSLMLLNKKYVFMKTFVFKSAFQYILYTYKIFLFLLFFNIR